MRRVPRRWRTPLGRWLVDFGVRRLADELRAAGHPITPNAVYKWVAGDVAPRPAHARVISRVSRGRVPIESIYKTQG